MEGVDWSNTIDGTRSDLIWNKYVDFEDIPQITKVTIDVKKSEASLRLTELGVNQYNFLKNLMPQANIDLIEEDIQTSDGKISGSIIIGLGGTK